MKKLFKKSLVLVVMFTAMLVSANEVSIRNLNDGNTTMVTLADVKQGNQLMIKDAFGIVLYKENIEKSGNYVKGFDLTSLPDGNYYFELDKELEIREIPFTVSLSQVKFNKENETVIYKPFIRSEKNVVYFSKLSLNNSPLKVKIYYSSKDTSGSYTLIHTESVENTKNIQRIFRLDESKEGTYKMVSESEGRIFIDFVQI